MSTIVLVEWSLTMCQSVLTWDPTSGKLTERITPTRNLTSSVANLSLNQRSVSYPTCIDFALTGVKNLVSKAAFHPAIVNGNLHSEPITYGSFDSSGIQNLAGSYEEFREKLSAALITSPPTNASYVSMFMALQNILLNMKSHAYVVLFTSTHAVMAAQEITATVPEVLRKFLPLNMDSSLFIVPVGPGVPGDHIALEFYRKLVNMNGKKGDVYLDVSVDESGRGLASIEHTINKLSLLLYRTFTATLMFGDLSGRIQLIPSPPTVRGGQNRLSEEFRVLGIMDKASVDKLFPTRQYFLLPTANNVGQEGVDVLQEPHIIPLLHASLRQMAGKVMLISVAKNWYGYVEPTEDARTKKKSGLVLTLFPEGAGLDSNKPIMLSDEDDEETKESNAVRDDRIPSYSAANAGYTSVWTSVESVQSDVAKLIRMAKRLPEKKDLFFKELNKIRIHALATCNVQLLISLTSLLLRETETVKDPHGVQELQNTVRQLRNMESFTALSAPLISVDGSVYSLEA